MDLLRYQSWSYTPEGVRLGVELHLDGCRLGLVPHLDGCGHGCVKQVDAYKHGVAAEAAVIMRTSFAGTYDGA